MQPRIALPSLVALFLVALFVAPCASTAVFSYIPDRTDIAITTRVSAPRMRNFGGENYVFSNFSGVLTSVTASRELRATKPTAVLLYHESGLSFEELVRREQTIGAAAVITVARTDGPPGKNMFFFQNIDCSDIKIPVVEISAADAALLRGNLSLGVNISVEISCCDENVWEVWHSSGFLIAVSVIVGAVSVFVFLLSFYKLALFVRFKPNINIATIVLVLVCIGNVARAISYTVDPIFSRRTIPNPWLYIFLTFNLPFSAIATLAVALYWLELIINNSAVAVSGFLQRLRWPFLIMGLLVMALELGVSVSRGLNYSISALIVLSALMYAVVYASVTILFSITGASVLRQLNRNAAATNTTDSDISRRIRDATIRLLWSILGNIAFIVCAILVPTSVFIYPVGGTLIFFVGVLALSFSDFCKVLAIRAPSPKRFQSSSESTQPTASPPHTPSHSPVSPRRQIQLKPADSL